MNKLASPGILFGAFVVAAVVGGISLAALEGQTDRNGVLEALLLISFVSMIPILIAAAVSARREVREGIAGAQRSSKRFPYLTPTRLFLFGVASEGISALTHHFATFEANTPLGIGLGIFTAATVPSFLASMVWALAHWTGRRNG